MEASAFDDKYQGPHDPDTLYRFAPLLIALQFAAFGWRINRELNLGYAERGTFVLIPDVLNIMGLIAAVIFLIVLPLATDTYFWLSRMVLAAGYVLIAFHPFTVAAHDRLCFLVPVRCPLSFIRCLDRNAVRGPRRRKVVSLLDPELP